jgi:hypothetical protein
LKINLNFKQTRLMKITATKIKRELEKNHGWRDLDDKDDHYALINELIKDTLKVVDKILMEQKGISIK